MISFSESQRAYITRTRKAREDSGKTQDEVADYLGLARPTYTGYENARPMPGKYVAKFCAITKTMEKWLLTGQGPQQHSDDIQELVDNYLKAAKDAQEAFLQMSRQLPKSDE